MKNSNFFLLAIATALLFSCNQNGKVSAVNDEDSLSADTISKNECYVAADELDSAFLKLKIVNNDKVEGTLLFTFEEKGKNDGAIEGVFKGDTLFVDYTFKIGPSKTVYKNPLALLKKDGKLILGVGQIETSLGKSYFVKGKQIDFDKGRFVFLTTDCLKQ